MKIRASMLVLAAVSAAAFLMAQTPAPRPPSPPGTAATQVLGKYVEGARGPSYQGGKWIEITYGRPIKRGREDLFGKGKEYGVKLNDGAPVWRAGANQTTRLKTEVPLVFEGKTLPAGEYDVFVELHENAWTLIFSTWPVQVKYDPQNKEALWGSYGYTTDKDALRATMKLAALPFSMDQFTIAFTNMTTDGGTIAMMWDKTMATVPFKVGS